MHLGESEVNMTNHPMPPKNVEGNRTRLIARKNDQAAEMFNLIDKNRENLGRWMPWEKETQKVEDSLAYLELAQSWWEARSTFDYSVYAKDSDKLIGGFGLHSINWEKQSCEFGYWLDQSYQGKGLMTEVVQIGEALAFDLGFHRIVITCDRLNLRSQQIPKRLNYRLESTQIDECIDHHGQYRDTLRFVKLLNKKVEGKITENLPKDYSIQESNSDSFWRDIEKMKEDIFSNDLILRSREVYSDLEREKLKILSAEYKHPFLYHAVVRHHDNVVGWTWGYQDSRDSFYMVNSAILPDHRCKGLYSRLLQVTLEKLINKGYQRVWSRHSMTNNEIIIPKLKQGFQITGTELSDVFGSLIHLTYFTNATRKKVLNFRSGLQRPDAEIKKLFEF